MVPQQLNLGELLLNLLDINKYIKHRNFFHISEDNSIIP